MGEQDFFSPLFTFWFGGDESNFLLNSKIKLQKWRDSKTIKTPGSSVTDSQRQEEFEGGEENKNMREQEIRAP